MSTDRLDALLGHFPVHAEVFHSGALCSVTDIHRPQGTGQIHLIRHGRLTVQHTGKPDMVVNAPSLLLYSRPLQRQFLPDAQEGTNLVCADLYFHGGANNPIVQALPDMLCLPLDRIDGANPILPLLFDEAFGDKCGRRVLVDRLFEVVLIHVLRHLMEEHQVHGGMLAGLSHPKLRKALTAMHEHPANAWSLQALADTAGMSRSLFAETFRRTVGCTPGAYLQSWRVRLAQQALQQGQPLKVVAAAIGYGSEAALSRAFKSQCGMTPREWRAAV